MRNTYQELLARRGYFLEAVSQVNPAVLYSLAASVLPRFESSILKEKARLQMIERTVRDLEMNREMFRRSDGPWQPHYKEGISISTDLFNAFVTRRASRSATRSHSSSSAKRESVPIELQAHTFRNLLVPFTIFLESGKLLPTEWKTLIDAAHTDPLPVMKDAMRAIRSRMIDAQVQIEKEELFIWRWAEEFELTDAWIIDIVLETLEEGDLNNSPRKWHMRDAETSARTIRYLQELRVFDPEWTYFISRSIDPDRIQLPPLREAWPYYALAMFQTQRLSPQRIQVRLGAEFAFNTTVFAIQRATDRLATKISLSRRKAIRGPKPFVRASR